MTGLTACLLERLLLAVSATECDDVESNGLYMAPDAVLEDDELALTDVDKTAALLGATGGREIPVTSMVVDESADLTSL